MVMAREMCSAGRGAIYTKITNINNISARWRHGRVLDSQEGTGASGDGP